MRRATMAADPGVPSWTPAYLRRAIVAAGITKGSWKVHTDELTLD